MPEWFLLEMRKMREAIKPLRRGKVPHVPEDEGHWVLNIIGSVFILIFSIVLGIILKSAFIGIFFALLLLSLFLFLPYYVILHATFKTGKKPTDQVLKEFSKRYDWLHKSIIAQELVEITPSDEEGVPITAPNPLNTPGFSLWLGKSTGLLSTLWHRAGMAANQHIALNLADACQNILVLGGIGSGKTTGVMQPLLLPIERRSSGCETGHPSLPFALSRGANMFTCGERPQPPLYLVNPYYRD